MILGGAGLGGASVKAVVGEIREIRAANSFQIPKGSCSPLKRKNLPHDCTDREFS